MLAAHAPSPPAQALTWAALPPCLTRQRFGCHTAAQMKQDGASAFIQSLRADSESSVPLGLDPALLVAAGRGKGLVSPAFLAACVATMDLPLRHCAVVAANGSVMQARPAASRCLFSRQ